MIVNVYMCVGPYLITSFDETNDLDAIDYFSHNIAPFQTYNTVLYNIGIFDSDTIKFTNNISPKPLTNSNYVKWKNNGKIRSLK